VQKEKKEFNILQVGSGDGKLLKLLQNRIQKELQGVTFHLYGIDCIARRLSGLIDEPNLTIINGPSTNLSRLGEAGKDSSLDIIIDYGLTTCGVVDKLNIVRKTCKEWARTLKLGGYVISVPYAATTLPLNTMDKFGFTTVSRCIPEHFLTGKEPVDFFIFRLDRKDDKGGPGDETKRRQTMRGPFDNVQDEEQAFRVEEGLKWAKWLLRGSIPIFLTLLITGGMAILIGDRSIYTIVLLEGLGLLGLLDFWGGAKYFVMGVVTYRRMLKAGFSPEEARQQAIALSKINYEDNQFKRRLRQHKLLLKEVNRLKKESPTQEKLQAGERALRTNRERLNHYLTEQGITSKAAYAFLGLALSQWYRNPINWAVARWIMTHEKVESQFGSHIMGMLGVFPVVGWLIIRPVGYIVAPITSRRAKRKELRSIAEFAQKRLSSEYKLSKLTTEGLLEIDEVFNWLELSDFKKGTKMYVRLLLLEEVLNNRVISDGFVEKLITDTISGLRALESLGKITDGIEIKTSMLNRDFTNFAIRLFNYLAGADICTEKDGNVVIETPETIYPISRLLLKKIRDLELLYIGADIPEETLDYFEQEMLEKGFLRRCAEAAYSGRIKDDLLEEFHHQLLATRESLGEPELDYSEEAFDLIKGHIFRGGLRDIVDKALAEDFRGIRDRVRELLFDGDPYVRQGAIQIAKDAYKDDEEIMKAVKIAEVNIPAPQPSSLKWTQEIRKFLRGFGISVIILSVLVNVVNAGIGCGAPVAPGAPLWDRIVSLTLNYQSYNYIRPVIAAVAAIVIIWYFLDFLRQFLNWRGQDPERRKQVSLAKFTVVYGLLVAKYLLAFVLTALRMRRVIVIEDRNQLDNIVNSPFYYLDSNIYFIPNGKVMSRDREGSDKWEGPVLLAHGGLSFGRVYLAGEWRVDKALSYLKKKYGISRQPVVITCETRLPHYGFVQSKDGVLSILWPAQGEEKFDIYRFARGD
ncbi:hypothetical protein MUO65_07770, partial [bacterium]|nr:hypothetical protein [bacterium]